MTTIANSTSNRIFNSPASGKPGSKRTDVNSSANTPIFQTQCFTFVCQYHIVTLVSVLLVRSSPSAIPRFVIATLVWIAINAVSGRWSRTHVLKKRLKRRSPSFAHLNAVRTIPLVVFIAAVVASCQHRAPRTVCKRSRFIVRYWTNTVKCIAKTSTACAAITAKAATKHSAKSSTFASAVPHGTTLLIQPSIAKNSPSPNDLSGQVFYPARRNRDRIGISHVSALLSERNVVRAESQLELRCRSLLLQNPLAAQTNL